MIVNHFNSHWSGGAAIAAKRLHQGLLELAVDSRFWCGNLPASQIGAEGYQDWRRLTSTRGPWGKLAARLWRKWRKQQHRADTRKWLSGRAPDLEVFTMPRHHELAVEPARMEGDILHLHWIAQLLDQPSFFAAIPRDLPVVWTLHDMNPFTGGCHFSGDCEAFRTMCGNCPQLPRARAHDLAAKSFQIKRRAYKEINLHVVAPSRWLQRQARRSGLLAGARSFQTIPYGLDVELFHPHDKPLARRSLNLPEQGVVIAFGADSITNRRKGFAELVKALAMLKTKSPVIALVFGNSPPDLRQESPLADTRWLGYIDDPRQQALVYSAADLVVIPSLEDNLPNIGLEALACGTPVVGFETGGIPDYVRRHETGLLARPGCADDLALQIGWLVDRPEERARMGHNARQLVVREFHQAVQAASYRELYERLSEERRRLAAGRRAA